MIHCPVSPDPLPTVIFEAIECETPVIYTDLGGAYEILDSGKNGVSIDHLSIKNQLKLFLNLLRIIFNKKKY